MNWAEFFSFRRMITPVLIQVIFWLGVAISVIGGIGLIAGDRPGLGILWIVIGPLVVRVYCELLIVIFRIHDSLKAVEQNTSPSLPTSTPGS
jgi:hypothetical protein